MLHPFGDDNQNDLGVSILSEVRAAVAGKSVFVSIVWALSWHAPSCYSPCWLALTTTRSYGACIRTERLRPLDLCRAFKILCLQIGR
jgi:hypothetical protein